MCLRNRFVCFTTTKNNIVNDKFINFYCVCRLLNKRDVWRLNNYNRIRIRFTHVSVRSRFVYLHVFRKASDTKRPRTQTQLILLPAMSKGVQLCRLVQEVGGVSSLLQRRWRVVPKELVHLAALRVRSRGFSLLTRGSHQPRSFWLQGEGSLSRTQPGCRPTPKMWYK